MDAESDTSMEGDEENMGSIGIELGLDDTVAIFFWDLPKRRHPL